MRCAWRGLLSVGVPVLCAGRGSRVRGRYIQSHLRPAVLLIDPATDVQDLLLLPLTCHERLSRIMRRLYLPNSIDSLRRGAGVRATLLPKHQHGAILLLPGAQPKNEQRPEADATIAAGKLISHRHLCFS